MTDNLFRALIAASTDGVVVIDTSGTVQVCNEACGRLFGYAASEIVGQHVQLLMLEPFHGEPDASHWTDNKTRAPNIVGREVVGRRKDGSTFPASLSTGKAASDAGRLDIGIFRDLTQIKAEIAQGEGARRILAEIAEQSDDAILSKTLDGVIVAWNRSAERMFGYSATEAIGSPITMLIPKDRLAEEDQIIGQLRAGQKIQNYETLRMRKDGSAFEVSISVSPIRDREGTIVSAAKIVRDISARKAAEARLRTLQDELTHVARLSAMGQMSSGLAHELNQPLAAINNYVHAARRMLDSDEPSAIARARDMIDKAAGQVQRAGAIIRNLRVRRKTRREARAGGPECRCRGSARAVLRRIGAPWRPHRPSVRTKPAARAHRPHSDPAGAGKPDPQRRRSDAGRRHPRTVADHAQGQ